MYLLILWSIKWLRRIRRRIVQLVGKDLLDNLSDIASHVIELLKDLSGIRLAVPIIGLMFSPTHLTSKGLCWKGKAVGPFPKPLSFLLSAASLSTVLLARVGFKMAWLKVFGVLILVSVLSPLWLLALTGVIFLLIGIVVMLFKIDNQGKTHPFLRVDSNEYLILFSIEAWRRLDWARFYYFLCYFWIYAALIITFAAILLLAVWQLPALILIAASRLFPQIRETLRNMTPEEFHDYLHAIYSSNQYAVLLTILVPIVFLVPALRLFIRPYAILFRNCLKIPTELSYKAQFRDLNEQVADIFWRERGSTITQSSLVRMRLLTAQGFQLLLRQERRASKYGLAETYFQERSVFALSLREVIPYLDRNQDHDLIRQIEDVVAGKSLLASRKLIAGRRLLCCAETSGLMAEPRALQSTASQAIEIADQYTANEQLSNEMDSLDIQLEPSSRSWHERFIEAVRSICSSNRVRLSLILAGLLVLAYSGAAHWKDEKEREEQIQEQIRDQEKQLAKRFFDDLYLGKDPCKDPTFAGLITEAEKCDRALENCYHVPHKDICRDPSVSVVFPNRQVCDDVAAGTYPVCP